MFKKDTIRKRVMAVIESRINTAQHDYDAEEKILVENFDKEVKELEAKLEVDKESAMLHNVDLILGKVL